MLISLKCFVLFLIRFLLLVDYLHIGSDKAGALGFPWLNCLRTLLATCWLWYGTLEIPRLNCLPRKIVSCKTVYCENSPNMPLLGWLLTVMCVVLNVHAICRCYQFLLDIFFLFVLVESNLLFALPEVMLFDLQVYFLSILANASLSVDTTVASHDFQIESTPFFLKCNIMALTWCPCLGIVIMSLPCVHC